MPEDTPVIRVRIATVSAEVLAWNTGPPGAVTGVLGVCDAAVAGAGPGEVMVAAGRERTGPADVPARRGPRNPGGRSRGSSAPGGEQAQRRDGDHHGDRPGPTAERAGHGVRAQT